MPNKAKSKNINRVQKQEQWCIKKIVSDEVVDLLCNLINYQLIICSSYYLSFFIFHFFILKLTQLRKITYIDPFNNAPIKMYPKNIQVKFSEQNRPPLKHLYKLVNNNITLNLNIASYFISILASPYGSTWFSTGGTKTKTIKHLGLTKHHQKKV